jgi:hypothetical protein
VPLERRTEFKYGGDFWAYGRIRDLSFGVKWAGGGPELAGVCALPAGRRGCWRVLLVYKAYVERILQACRIYTAPVPATCGRACNLSK